MNVLEVFFALFLVCVGVHGQTEYCCSPEMFESDFTVSGDLLGINLEVCPFLNIHSFSVFCHSFNRHRPFGTGKTVFQKPLLRVSGEAMSFLFVALHFISRNFKVW